MSENVMSENGPTSLTRGRGTSAFALALGILRRTGPVLARLTRRALRCPFRLTLGDFAPRSPSLAARQPFSEYSFDKRVQHSCGEMGLQLSYFGHVEGDLCNAR